MKSKELTLLSIGLSVVATVLAVLDALNVSVWLSASTWLIVAILFAVWALYCQDKS